MQQLPKKIKNWVIWEFFLDMCICGTIGEKCSSTLLVSLWFDIRRLTLVLLNLPLYQL